MADFKSGENDDNDSPEALNVVKLPDQLILDVILPRLAVKTLIRFKSVSKFWHSEISTPEFAELHLPFSCSSSHQFLLLSFYPPKTEIVPYDDLNNVKDPVNLDFDLESCFVEQNQQGSRLSETVEFVGTCNGLVCLYKRYVLKSKKLGLFAICNPALHEYCHIPNPDSRDLLASDYWFGYLPSINDYKIVVEFSSQHNVEFHVFSLRTGKWKRFYDLERVCSASVRMYQKMKVLNNLLYWYPCSLVIQEQKPEHIVVFDLVYEKVKEFPWMDWLNEYLHVDLYEVNGCLTLLCCSSRGYDFWELKQPHNWGSWEKSSKTCRESWCVLNMASTGKFFVLDRLRDRLKIVDLTKGSEEQSQREAFFIGHLQISGSGDYVESLISPLGFGIFTKNVDDEV